MKFSPLIALSWLLISGGVPRKCKVGESSRQIEIPVVFLVPAGEAGLVPFDLFSLITLGKRGQRGPKKPARVNPTRLGPNSLFSLRPGPPRPQG